MARGIEIKIDGLEHLKEYLAAMPSETESVLRRSAKRAVQAGHNEALIQISRRYTISMNATERNLYEETGNGSAIYAQLIAKGRRRRIFNFEITPKKLSKNWLDIATRIRHRGCARPEKPLAQQLVLGAYEERPGVDILQI